MDQVRTTLSEANLNRLIDAFDREHMEELFLTVMKGRYARTENYINVLDSLFHEDTPPDPSTTRPRLSEEDRERCIIAILASRGNVRNLAVHIYVALMLKVTPEEIADIIFLAGVYSGVPAVADGLDTQIKTLQALEAVANARGKPDINAVFAELSKLPL